MPLVNLNVRTAGRDHAIRLDLDPARPNEDTILGFLRGGKLYEPDIAEVFLRALRDGDTVLDVGANIGFFSLLAARLVGPGGRVIGFEPVADNLERLAANIAHNGLDTITFVEFPASDRIGDTVFHLNSDNQGGHSLWAPGDFPPNARSRETPRSIATRTTTIDAERTLLGFATPRLIKIDTEGAEHRVLAGAAGLLRESRVPYVIAELHEFGLERMGSSQASLRGFMAELGYETFLLYQDGSLPKLVPRDTRIESRHFLNLLFSTLPDVAALWPAENHDPSARERRSP